MHSTDTSRSDSSSIGSPQRFSAVRMPIEEPVENTDEAVAKLRQCDSTELRRARKHHRRALESLQNGGYSCLSDATRTHLAARLRNNLDALNQALDTSPAPAAPTTESSADESDPDAPSISSRFRAFFQGLWPTH